MGNKWLGLFPEARKNNVNYFLDGDGYFKELVTAIESTKSGADYIYIAGWMIDIEFELIDGNKETTLSSLLGRASKRGVEIRILIWDTIIPEYAVTLESAIKILTPMDKLKIFSDRYTFTPTASRSFVNKGIEPIIEFVEKIDRFLGKISSLGFASRDYNKIEMAGILGLLHNKLKEIKRVGSVGAHHEKVVIVRIEKGLIGFCGGTDLNKNRVYSTYGKQKIRSASLHDSACKIIGPAAHEILLRFVRRWANHNEANAFPLIGATEKPSKEIDSDFHYAKAVGTFNGFNGPGKEDRSFRESFYKIIENASNYIYTLMSNSGCNLPVESLICSSMYFAPVFLSNLSVAPRL